LGDFDGGEDGFAFGIGGEAEVEGILDPIEGTTEDRTALEQLDLGAGKGEVNRLEFLGAWG